MRFDQSRECMRSGCGIVARTFQGQRGYGRQIQIQWTAVGGRWMQTCYGILEGLFGDARAQFDAHMLETKNGQMTQLANNQHWMTLRIGLRQLAIEYEHRLAHLRK